jgi:pimeloyl-ACP methyl ester carboxylesterase
MELQELGAYRHTAATRSGDISYLDVGSGPVALFVHGIGTNAYLWRHVIGALAGPDRRCVALDLPLHGQTPVTPEQDLSVAGLASVLGDFCEALELTGIDLVANDTGGAIAQVFAARQPHRLTTLTLTNCDVSGNLPPEAFKSVVELAAARELAPLAVAMVDDIDAAARMSFGNGYENMERTDSGVYRSYLEPCVGTMERAREFERLLVSLDSIDLRAVEPQLRMLTVPTLVVWGTGDVFFDVSWAYWLRDTIPGVTRVVTIEGAKLFFPEERPMDLVPHLAQHWASARAASPVA